MVHQGQVLRSALPNGGMRLAKAASSLRPHIVQVMAVRQGCIMTTEEIYALVADLGVAGFNPSAKRDRNLVQPGNCRIWRAIPRRATASRRPS